MAGECKTENTGTAAFSCTVRELAARGMDNLPDAFQTAKHLIYSSPATLAFNSPGAEGYGVKRAGLSIPGSVMLIVSPGCCGRNTAEITAIKGYDKRFFYLTMDETDLVTGRHLKKIPGAVKEIVDFLEEKPSVVMICLTCVDALLGTDMERIARAAETEAGVIVRPCYMYALTREGRRPPMVHVRQSLYSLLPKRKRRGSSVNLLGFFAPYIEEFELYGMLKSAGVKKIREIGACDTIEDFYAMGEANFNLVLNPEARDAARDLADRLGIPFIELTRFYDTERISRQYKALNGALGTAMDTETGRKAADQAAERAERSLKGLNISIGEAMNGNPYEMALALTDKGFCVKEIFANPSEESFPYIRQLAEKSPEIRLYSNMEPTMLYYHAGEAAVDLVIGKDAAFYHPEAKALYWNEDRQPYGYAGVRKLYDAIYALFAEQTEEL